MNSHIHIFLLASEQDAIRGNTINIQGYLFIYVRMYVRMSFLYYDPGIFVCLVGDPVNLH